VLRKIALEFIMILCKKELLLGERDRQKKIYHNTMRRNATRPKWEGTNDDYLVKWR
jgi:predicted transcriptional regulator